MIGLEIDLAAIVDRRHPQHRAGLLAQDLPRHDVRVVFQPRQQHFVAGLQVRPPVGLRHQVDPVGRSGRQDDGLGVGRIDEARGLGAGALVRLGRALAQQMRGAMDVGVGVAIVVVESAQHRFRFLTRVGAVEIHERLAVHEFAQDREICPDRRHIKGQAQAWPHHIVVGLGFSRARRGARYRIFKLCGRQGLYPIA